MYGLNREEKLRFVLEVFEKGNITAYEVSQNTNLTEAGVQKIIKGITKNPQERSLNEIILFFEKRQLENKLNIELFQVAAEPEIKYPITDNDKLIKCLEEKNNLTMEVIHLQNLLRNNGIEFMDYFEKKK